MGARTRQRSGNKLDAGYALYKGLNLKQFDFTPANSYLLYESCSDVTMPRPYNVDHGLSITKIVTKPTVLNGIKPIGGSYGNLELHAYNLHPYSADSPSVLFTAVNTAYYRTLALANLSPYRSSVNLPLFLFELRELPGMLQQLGRVLKKQVKPSDVAGGYLAYSFGWAPLVADLLSLFDMTKKIEDRKAYFRRLENGTRLKRQLGTKTVRETANYLNTSYTHVGTSESATVYRGRAKLKETQRVWYTVNAKLRFPGSQSAADLHSLSRAHVLGLHINPSDVWDAIPWSWLIDYFLNVGDMLEAFGAMVGVMTTRMNLMCESKIVVSYETAKLQREYFTVSPGYQYATWKQRFPYANPTPQVTTIPFFTNHMAGILGSLGVVKALKASGIR